LASRPEKETEERPGRNKLVVSTLPKLELTSAGVETNVFDSQTGAVLDASVLLRPSLASAMPVGRRLSVIGEGYLALGCVRRERTECSTDFGGQGRAEAHFGPLTSFGAGGGQTKQTCACLLPPATAEAG